MCYAAFVLLVLAASAGATLYLPSVYWSLGDFAAAIGVFALVHLMVEIAFRLARSTRQLWFLVVMSLGVGALIWAELAVGLFN
jgi:hypothetical protein